MEQLWPVRTGLCKTHYYYYDFVCVQCVLAAVVIANLRGVFLQALDIPALYRQGHYYDLVLSFVMLLLSTREFGVQINCSEHYQAGVTFTLYAL